MSEAEYKEVQLGPRKIEIPKEWSFGPISSALSTLESGGRPRTDDRQESDSVLSIGGGHISFESTFDLSDPVWISEEYYEDMNSGKIKEDDVLLVKDGATIGKSLYVDSVPENKAAVNSHVYNMRATEENEPRFLYYFLSSKNGLDQIDRLTTGSAQAGLNKSFQKVLKIPLPPLPEQRRIAEILSTVDEAIQQTDEIIETSKELKKGLMQDLFEKGFNNNYDTQETPYGPFPENWDMEPLKNLTTSDISYGIVKPGDYHEDGVPMVRANDIKDGKIIQEPFRVSEEKSKEYERTRIEEGDILLSVMGTVGRSMRATSRFEGGNVNRALSVIRLDDSEILPTLVDFWFRSSRMQSFFEREKYGTAQKRINISFLKSMKIPIPPREEQEKIAEVLSNVDEKIRQEEEYREKLEELKKGLMQDMLTGKKRVEA